MTFVDCSPLFEQEGNLDSLTISVGSSKLRAPIVKVARFSVHKAIPLNLKLVASLGFQASILALDSLVSGRESVMATPEFYQQVTSQSANYYLKRAIELLQLSTRSDSVKHLHDLYFEPMKPRKLCN